MSRGTLGADRRLLFALGLSLLMPGLGHIYCGRVRVGLQVWGGVLAVWVLCLLVWASWIFAPVLPAAVLALAWLALQASLMTDLVAVVRRSRGVYALHPLNHGVAYLSMFLGLGVLPLAASLVVVGRTRVGSLEVRSEAMFPHLLPGDRILFDRLAYAVEAPIPADLVVVDGPGGQPMVARVVAVEGQVVHLRDGRLVVDGQPLQQGPLADLQVPRFGPQESLRLAELDGFLEDNRGRRYVVTYDRERPERLEPAPERLGPGEVYVVGDNRDEAVEGRWHGRVQRGGIRGQPRCIWASYDPTGASRAGRAGLEIH